MSGSVRAVDVTDSAAITNGRIPKTDSMSIYCLVGFSIILLVLSLATTMSTWFILASIITQMATVYLIRNHLKAEALKGNKVVAEPEDIS